MRVLLTGASGFIGRHVMRLLRDAGHEVHAVSSRPAPTPATTLWHVADLLQPDRVRHVVGQVKPEGLVHLAWITTPPDYWRSPENLSWVAASKQLFQAFRDAGGQRAVAAGTCAEYDWRYGYCVERLTPLAPATLYGRAKADAGSFLESLAADAGFSAAWARLFFLLGPHEHPSRLVPSLVRDLIAGKPARCNSGALFRDFLHVEDAATAIVALFGSAVTGPVNVASGMPVSIAAVASAVAARVGRPDLLQISAGDDEHPLVVASTQRLKNDVGWAPRRDFAASIADAVDWWRSSPLVQVDA